MCTFLKMNWSPRFGSLHLCVRLGCRLEAIILAVIVLANCTGCGSNRCPISGEVTFDGKPVQNGTITFEPIDGQGPTSGGKVTDGRYSLVGDAALLPDKKAVRISASHKTGRKVPAGPPAPPGTMVDEIKRFIPAIYNVKTTLSCDITPEGSKIMDFHLKSP